MKTVNNCLSTLSMMLKMAVKWKVIDRMPVEIEHLKGADSTVEFYEVEEYERLVDAAGKLGPVQQIVMLLGGDAGLRMGEMIALEWSDVDLKRGLLKVQRSDWRGTSPSPRGPPPGGAADAGAGLDARSQPPPAGRAGALPRGWDAGVPADGPLLDGRHAEAGGAQGDGGASYPPPHVL